MDSFTFGNIRVEKASASSRYRRFFAITIVLRLVELIVFVIVVSRFSSQFSFPFKESGEYFRGITVTLISPRFVFLLGNAIVIVLFLKSGRFSEKIGDRKIADNFYDEYVEKCRGTNNHQQKSKDGKAAGARGCAEEGRIIRSRSENVGREWRQEDERRRELRRSETEVQRKTTDCRRRLAATERSSYSENEMNGEEFRRTVEAFIARQQRCLRGEE